MDERATELGAPAQPGTRQQRYAVALAYVPRPVTHTAMEDPLKYASKLPVGQPIHLVPRAEKRGTAVVVVTADHVVTLSAHTGPVRQLTASAEGLLVSALSGLVDGLPDPDQALYLIRPDGSLTRLRKGPFDGLTVSRTESAATTSLLGWTTQGLLVSDDSDGSHSRIWLWEPGATSRTEIPGVEHPSVMTTDPGRLLVDTERVEAPTRCLHLYTLNSRQMGPALACGLADRTVSPDGRRVVSGSVVLDLTSGRVGPELLDSAQASSPHWEDSTHVLLEMFETDPQGLAPTPVWVRCDVITGACEQAPVKGSKGTRAIEW